MIYLVLLLLVGCSEVSSEFNVSEIEMAAFDQINELRGNDGLPVLEYNSDYSDIARLHSQDMIDREYIGHVSPDGLEVSDRMGDVFYGPLIAENIHHENREIGVLASEVGLTTMYSWLNSTQGHRENMLDPRWEMAGLGVAIASSPVDDRYKISVTQLYSLGGEKNDRYKELEEKILAIDAEMEELNSVIASKETIGQHSNDLRRRYNALNANRTKMVEEHSLLSN